MSHPRGRVTERPRRRLHVPRPGRYLTRGADVPQRIPTLIRFRSHYVVAASGCWEWTGHITRKGYGDFSFCGRSRLAHQASYMMFIGPIPVGLEIDHLCRVRHCVNPDHLEAVTHAENLRRAVRVPRTHCTHGHEYTPENTIRTKVHGTNRLVRRCRICYKAKWQIANRKATERRRAAREGRTFE